MIQVGNYRSTFLVHLGQSEIIIVILGLGTYCGMWNTGIRGFALPYDIIIKI